MNNRDKYKDENKSQLKLFGSQMSFSSRGSSGSIPDRPRSAILPHRGYIDFNSNSARPRSAGSIFKNNFPLSSSGRNLHWTTNINESKADGKSTTSLHQYTDSSSKLLQNLLGTPGCYGDDGKSNEFSHNIYSESISSEENPVSDKTSKTSLNLNNDPNYSISQSSEIHSHLLNINTDMRRGSIEECKFHSWFPYNREEKTVRFLETHKQVMDREMTHHHHFCHSAHHCCHRNQRSQLCNHYRMEQESEIPRSDLNHLNVKVQNENDKLSEKIKNTIEAYEIRDFSEVVKDSEDSESEIKQQSGDAKTNSVGPTSEELTSSQASESENVGENDNKKENLVEVSSELVPKVVVEEEKEKDQTKTEENCKKICSNSKLNESTYEEIVRLLETLEEEDSESLNLKNKDSGENSPEPTESNEKINDVYTYLEELEKDISSTTIFEDNNLNTTSKSYDSPRLDELLNKNSVELAHEVLSLKIQIEDQKKGIKLLRDTIAEMKEAKKVLELEHQESLHKAESEAEVMVQRHQKFIKQLLNEKKNLNETVSKLVQDLKAGEERHKKNLKAVEEKHQIEIKRAKEIQAAADKIKREKWMETKTKKIKEMTVKGLEPELSRMAARQQEEMTELRNLQRAELEAVELRAARRTSELMDDLRAELTKEKEHAISRETAAVRASMEKEFEDERNKTQKQIQILKDRIHKEEIKLTNQEMEFQQRLIDYKREAEKENQKIGREYQERLEEINRRHGIELKNLRETFEAEKEIWINNYKKQQAAKYFEREAELHQQYKKERDRDIEVIIEALEKESSQTQMELNKANENKLRRLKEQLEGEIKEIEASELALKGKLAEAKAQLLEKEEHIAQLNIQIRQLQTEATILRKSCEEMSKERANLKEIVKTEFENKIKELIKEKDNLDKQIIVLKELHLKDLAKKDQIIFQSKNEMQKELTRVYSRVKSAVNKKEKIIESLKEENKAINQKCEQLELMLDRQRRNLLLQ